MSFKPAPLKTALSDAYPNPSNAVMRTGLGALWDWATSLLGTTGDPADARSALGVAGLTGRNRLINGNFANNQRGVSGTVTLAAGAYGHDRWKAGASGCTYTFTTSGIDTVITITAGSLMQVVEDKNIEGGVYAVSHAGTAQARVAVNGASTSGSYAAATQSAPLLSASATANQTVTVEFSTGTVSKVMVEPGVIATAFERRPHGMELALCQRYFQSYEFVGVSFIATAAGQQCNAYMSFPPMRAAPVASPGATTANVNASARATTVRDTQVLLQQATSAAAGVVVLENPVTLSAEL